MKYKTIAILTAVVLLALPFLADAATVTVRWSTVPQPCADGSSASNCPITGYAIRRQSGTAAPVLLGSVLSSTAQYVDLNVPAGTYVYSVVASSDAGPSLPSSAPPVTISAPVPGPPAGVTVTVAVVTGVPVSPAFTFNALTLARSSAVAGFVDLGRPCLGDPVFNYRGKSYRRVATTDVRWWNTTQTVNVAAPCAAQS